MLLQQSEDGLLRGRLEWNMMCGQGRGEGWKKLSYQAHSVRLW